MNIQNESIDKYWIVLNIIRVLVLKFYMGWRGQYISDCKGENGTRNKESYHLIDYVTY